MNERLLDGVRAFLRDNPGVSRRQLVEGVGGGVRDVTAAFDALVERGEAIYIKPEGRGRAGRCVLRPHPGVSPGHDDGNDGDGWKPDVRCPSCGRPPAIRFTEREVLRARRDRQSARIQNYRCNRCGTVYWIQAKHIAAATLDAELRAA